MYGKMYKEPSSEWAEERLLWNTMQELLGWLSQVLVLSRKVLFSSQRGRQLDDWYSLWEVCQPWDAEFSKTLPKIYQ